MRTETLFLGAYFQDELIGFIRMTYADEGHQHRSNLSVIKHFDKRPNNALIAKAVEICEKEGCLICVLQLCLQ